MRPVDRILLVHASEASTTRRHCWREAWRVAGCRAAWILAVVPTARFVGRASTRRRLPRLPPIRAHSGMHLACARPGLRPPPGEGSMAADRARRWFLRSAYVWERTRSPYRRPFGSIHLRRSHQASLSRRFRRANGHLMPALQPVLGSGIGADARQCRAQRVGRALIAAGIGRSRRAPRRLRLGAAPATPWQAGNGHPGFNRSDHTPCAAVMPRPARSLHAGAIKDGSRPHRCHCLGAGGGRICHLASAEFCGSRGPADRAPG